ncbi:MAG: Holliday junction resolvase RuvX [bacterium]
MRIICFDPGTVRIGVSISDETEYLARPIGNIKNDERLDRQLKELGEKNEFGKIIVGEPFNMDGTRNPHNTFVGQLVDRLKIIFPDKEIIMWDERLSSWEANNIMLEADLSRKKRKKKVDALAAVLILQNYLDKSRERKK